MYKSVLTKQIRLSGHDYAKKVIARGLIESAYSVNFEIDEDNQLHLSFKKDGKPVEAKEFDCAGLYTIYNGLPGPNNVLYVGQSDSSVYHRVYRFIKGYLGRNRLDEDHPAAEWFRQSNEPFRGIYFKWLSPDRFPPGHFDMPKPLDEYIAEVLGSKFNVRKAGMYD